MSTFCYINERITQLADAFVQRDIVPAKARVDAVHIAAAAINGMDFLLTWNCRHLANVDVIKKLEAFLSKSQLFLPTICTPVALLGE